MRPVVLPLTAAAALCVAAGPATAPATRPSVDQRIDALLAAPPKVARPTPGNATGKGPAHAAPPATLSIVREGTTLEDQVGRLNRTADGHTAVFTFDSDGRSIRNPAMIVLPNLELEALERRQQSTPGQDVRFRVGGMVTEYQGRNYLLLSPSSDAAVSADGPPGPLPLPPSRAVDTSSGPAAVAPAAPTVRVVRGGTYLHDRLGRLNHDADGRPTTFTFDDDGRTMRDPPMVLLQNLKLATMEAQQVGSSKDVKFRVSGTVTEYGGRNYLLLDKVVVVQDFDSEF